MIDSLKPAASKCRLVKAVMIIGGGQHPRVRVWECIDADTRPGPSHLGKCYESLLLPQWAHRDMCPDRECIGDVHYDKAGCPFDHSGCSRQCRSCLEGDWHLLE